MVKLCYLWKKSKFFMFLQEEGYIKFQAHWQLEPPLQWSDLEMLDFYRQQLYSAGLIGLYPDGIGYGNISQRWRGGSQFVITGSATGQYAQLEAKHYSIVDQVEVASNELWCKGPIVASSESMSHAVIYAECPWVEAVVHVHHLGLWQRLLHHYPTTAAEAAYGTPGMAYSIIQLLRQGDLPKRRLLVMQGHVEGLIAFGSLQEACSLLLRLKQDYEHPNLVMGRPPSEG